MDDFLRNQIESAASPERSLEAAARLRSYCWPGGAADRSEPAALAWLTRWWPERLGAAIPACSCPRGRCQVCN